MSIVLLQSQRGNSTVAVNTLNVTFPNPVTAGSLLVCYAGSTATSRTFTASDNTNGAYTNDIASNGGAGSCAILTFPGGVNGSPSPGPGPTVALVLSGAAGEMDAIIEEWAGIQTSSAIDKVVASSGVAVNTGTGGTTATLTQQNELALSLMHLNGNGTISLAAQSPFTPSPSSPTPTSGSIILAAGYNLVGASTAAQTCTFNWTNNVNYRSCTATYKSPPVGAQIAPLMNRKYVLFYT